MRNELLEQYSTQTRDPILYGSEYTRLWKRYTYQKDKLEPCYTIAVKNNCIVANYATYQEAKAVFDDMQRKSLVKRQANKS